MTFHITLAQRKVNAVKAAATRRSRGIKAFGNKGHHGFKTMTLAQRKAAAVKAANTKRAKGEKVGGWGHNKK